MDRLKKKKVIQKNLKQKLNPNTMKKYLLLLIMIIGSFAAMAQGSRIYSTGDVLISSADTIYDISVNSFPKQTSGIIVEAIFKKMDGTAENGTAVKLYNAVSVDALGINPNPLFVDSLAYADGDGETYSEFAKIDFYSSALRLLIDPPGTESDTSTVQINLWAIEPNN